MNKDNLPIVRLVWIWGWAKPVRQSQSPGTPLSNRKLGDCSLALACLGLWPERPELRLMFARQCQLLPFTFTVPLQTNSARPELYKPSCRRWLVLNLYTRINHPANPLVALNLTVQPPLTPPHRLTSHITCSYHGFND